MRFLTVGLNPTLQRTVQVDRILHNGVNRAADARHDVAGKAANVARVLTQLDASVSHLSHAGGDNRDLWLAMCREDGIDVIAPEAPGAVRTCITIVEAETHTTTEFIEPSSAVDEATVRAVWQAFEAEVSRTDVLLICGSMAGGYPADFYVRMVERAHEEGVQVGLDIQGQVLREAIRRSPRFVKINAREFGATFTPELAEDLARAESHSLSVLDDERIRAKFQPVMVRLQAQGTTVMLSQGARPTVVLNPQTGNLEGVDTVPLDAVNTIGCGDTMTAGVASRFFAVDRVSGPDYAELLEAVEYGHTLAAINASFMKPGTIRP